MEDRLIRKADVLVAASENLRARILEHRDECTLLTHGVDLEHWNRVHSDSPVLAELESPIYLFWGVIDRRMDVEFLKALNDQMLQGTIALVGPQQNADPAITQLSRVRLLGSVGFDQLPAMAAAASVLIMPYVDAAVTRAMQPLKMKEYLATGKPAVARRLPALDSWHDTADLVETPVAFARQVLERNQIGVDERQLKARQRLVKESWAGKAQVLGDVIDS